MDSDLVYRMENVARVMALTAAANARIEGMKAENATRESNGHTLAYDDEAFTEVGDRLLGDARAMIPW